MKKGQTWGSFIGWALGVFVVVIIIFGVFGENQAMAKAKQAVYNLGYSTFGWGEPVEIKGEDDVPEAVETYLNSLRDKLRNVPSGSNCVISIGEAVEDSGYYVAAATDKIHIEKGQSDRLSPAHKSTQILGYKPCVVEGSAAVSFYDCAVTGAGNCAGQTLFSSKDDVALREDSYASYLYKVDGRTCFIKVYSDIGGTCNTPRNNGNDGVDDDCLAAIGRIPVCGSGASANGGNEQTNAADTEAVNWFTTIVTPVLTRTNSVASSTNCNLRLNLAGLGQGYFVSFERSTLKSKVQLGKYDEELSVTKVLRTLETEKILPYFAVRNNPTVLNDRFRVYNEIVFDKYYFSPNQRQLSEFGDQKILSGIRPEIVLIHRDGNWLVTDAQEVRNVQNQLGEACT